MTALYTPTLLLLAFIAGVLPALWKPLTPRLANHHGLDADSVHKRNRLVLLGVALIFPGCGFLVDRWGPQSMLVAGQLAAVFSLAWLAGAMAPNLVLLALFLLGIAEALIISALVPLLQTGLPFAPTKLAGLNLGFVMVGIGFITGRTFIDRWLERKDLPRALFVISLLGLAPVTLTSILNVDSFPARPRPEVLGDLLSQGKFWLVVALAFLFFPVEQLLFAWRDRFLKHPQHQSRWGLTGFWAAFLAARIFTALWVRDSYALWYLHILAIGYVIAVGNLAATSDAQGTIGLLLSALCFGPMLPTLCEVVLSGFKSEPATAVGICFGVACFAGFLAGPVIELVKQKMTLSGLMWSAVALMLVWIGVALVLAVLGPIG